MQLRWLRSWLLYRYVGALGTQSTDCLRRLWGHHTARREPPRRQPATASASRALALTPSTSCTTVAFFFWFVPNTVWCHAPRLTAHRVLCVVGRRDPLVPATARWCGWGVWGGCGGAGGIGMVGNCIHLRIGGAGLRVRLVPARPTLFHCCCFFVCYRSSSTSACLLTLLGWSAAAAAACYQTAALFGVAAGLSVAAAAARRALPPGGSTLPQ